MEFLNDPKRRGLFFQALALLVIALGIGYAYLNVQENLGRQNIASGFGFLEQEAGFEISETLIEYWSDDSYSKALWVGILNTLKVALIGNILAILLGLFVALGALSKNWLVAQLSRSYIGFIRNIPLLLQLFFWYTLFTDLLPGIKEAANPITGLYISNRGINFPILANLMAMKAISVSIVVAAFLFVCGRKGADRERQKMGSYPKWRSLLIPVSFLIPLAVWAVYGFPFKLDYPSLQGFNFEGGYSITPEFLALLLGLVLYTAAFNAEVIRSGILSVKKGQWEAAESLGLNRKRAMKLVILPQALRVIIPPLISQILNLTKNSSLAVAIAYPDFVAVANTTMNQTGQAVELVLLIMFVYLIISLTTSLLMNWYNKKISLVEK